MLGTADYGRFRLIRLYAHLKGSFRTVSEGLKLAFEEHKVLDGYYIGEALDFDADPVGGATSSIAVIVGDPLRCLMAHTHGEHKEIWLMLAPNSEGVPPQLVKQLTAKRGGRNTIDGLLAPSTWAKSVLEKEFPGIPVELCRHGVLPCFEVDRERRFAVRSRSSYQVLHITSTNLSRKGTRELIAAWKKAVDLRHIVDGRLLIAANPEYVLEFTKHAETHAQGYAIQVINGQNLSFSDLAKMYSESHLVIQPSRAEGFGLVPLEARACGVPVAMTACTGHWDHVRDGNIFAAPGVSAILLETSGSSDDYWGAVAPIVKEEGICLSLYECFSKAEDMWMAAMDNANLVRHRWTWTRGAESVVEKWKEKYV